MDYIEYDITVTPRDPWAEILIAELAELGFESFVETDYGIQAYAPVSLVNASNLLEKTTVVNQPEVQVNCITKIIPQKNWNAEWEASFEPVLVDSRLAIIAPFHQASEFSNKELIVIQPQMSFGTGHHQTTYLMAQLMLDLPQMPQKVLDMGTGTGVLAILAEKLAATEILAVDIEPWSVENTIENAERNQCKHITALTGDIDVVNSTNFGLILANINKNILKSHMKYYYNCCATNGILCLSGFFATDVEEMKQVAEQQGFKWIETKEKETWAAMKLIKE
jgi:ribosomal protein L11 methyltransferase